MIFFYIKSGLGFLNFCPRGEFFEVLDVSRKRNVPVDPGRPMDDFSSFHFLDTHKTSKNSPLGQKFKNIDNIFYGTWLVFSI